jgi:hypothetical protein
MDAFFSLGLLDEATRRLSFVQQISSSVRAPVTKVQTMPAEPIHRRVLTASRCAARGRAPLGDIRSAA